MAEQECPHGCGYFSPRNKCSRCRGERPTRITFDGCGGLYLPPEYAYIGVAMDRRDAADEMQRAFDGARLATPTPDETTESEGNR